MGWTAVHEATVSGNLVALEALLAAGASTDLGDYNGDTPLHLAVRYKNYQAIQLLLKYHAKIRIANIQGENALDLARSINYGPACILLQKSFSEQLKEHQVPK